MRSERTFGELATRGRGGAADCTTAGRTTAGDASLIARAASSAVTGASAASGARRTAGRAAAHRHGRACRSAAFDIELEAPIASRIQRAEPDDSERQAPASCPKVRDDHGSAESLLASSTAKPRG
jgi:hypothetical protein